MRPFWKDNSEWNKIKILNFQKNLKLKKKNEDEKNEDFFYQCYDFHIQNVKTSTLNNFKNV